MAAFGFRGREKARQEKLANALLAKGYPEAAAREFATKAVGGPFGGVLLALLLEYLPELIELFMGLFKAKR
jgi:hypothetical protein